MSKILTVALLMISSMATFADDSQDFTNLSVKNIVRAKLWYEGIQSAEKTHYEDAQGVENYPEELIIALDKFEI